jgi:heme oxygenase
MLVRLALETRQHHAHADGDRLALLEDASLTSYRAFLATVFGFEVRVEEALARTPRLDAELVRTRAKAELLAADLVGLGYSEPQVGALRRCSAVPAFRSPAQALGWLYVVERNTLLHGLLRRHLVTVMPQAMERAGSYLGAYGDTPGARHRELGEILDQLAKVAADLPQQLVTAANEAFRCQRHWFLQRRDQPIERADEAVLATAG